MKLMTLNTHSLMEADYEEKLKQFVETVRIEKPDVIALQEVSQRLEAEAADPEKLRYYVQAEEGVILKSDNHVMRIVNILEEGGLFYNWSWVPIKIGYDILEEGAALMSLHPITCTDSFYISKSQTMENWRCRKALGIQISDQGEKRWFYSVHMGWWKEEDGFLEQWARLKDRVKLHKPCHITLMGDFNNPAEIREQGYDRMIQDGWMDTWKQAEERDGGFTVTDAIDGWKDRKELTAMRIDYIMQNWIKNDKIVSSRVVFSGEKEPRVSDHCGILVVERS